MIVLLIPTIDLDTGLLAQKRLEESAGMEVDTTILYDRELSGFTENVNRGLEQALVRGADACVCVEDCEPRTDRWLRKLKTVLDTRKEVWFAGPSGPCRTPPQNTGLPGDGRKPQYVSHLAGFCLLIAHEALERVGLLRPELAHYGSDVDYQWRARKLGGRSVWVPYVYMDHELHPPRQPEWKRDNKIFNQLWR